MNFVCYFILKEKKKWEKEKKGKCMNDESIILGEKKADELFWKDKGQ